MTNERIEEMLCGYRQAIGRAEYLEVAIHELEQELKQWDESRIADMTGIGAVSMDGMPHGNKVGQPTERIAIMLADGGSSEGQRTTEALLRDYREELHYKRVQIRFVEALMKGLTEKQAFVISKIYFEKLTYRETGDAYRNKYGEYVTRDTVRNIRRDALERVRAITM